jgi:hypothetical protein
VGNYEGLISSQEGNGGFQAAPNFNADFDYVDLLPNSFGRLVNDRTHQLKVSGYYVLPFGVRLGLIASYFSGQPLTVYDIEGPGAYARPLVPRGSYGEMPSTYTVDLHLGYDLAVGTVSVSPVLDVFNLTDVQRATSRNQVYADDGESHAPPFTNPAPNPLFGKDVAWQSPRLVRLGVRVSF